jgi:hypothetical protein
MSYKTTGFTREWENIGKCHLHWMEKLITIPMRQRQMDIGECFGVLTQNIYQWRLRHVFCALFLDTPVLKRQLSVSKNKFCAVPNLVAYWVPRRKECLHVLYVQSITEVTRIADFLRSYVCMFKLLNCIEFGLGSTVKFYGGFYL